MCDEDGPSLPIWINNLWHLSESCASFTLFLLLAPLGCIHAAFIFVMTMYTQLYNRVSESSLLSNHERLNKQQLSSSLRSPFWKQMFCSLGGKPDFVLPLQGFLFEKALKQFFKMRKDYFVYAIWKLTVYAII